jgi:predicted esterase
MRDGRHGESVGATWLTREDREADLEDHLAYLDRLVSHLTRDFRDSPRLTILGFSQGSVMAARWVSRGRVVPDRLVLWGTPLPRDVTPEGLASVRAGRAVCLTAGDRDPFAPEGTIEADAEALQARGVRAVARRFRGGHAIPPGALLDTAERAR